MKKPHESIWQTNLDDDDWNFSEIQNDEWAPCLLDELLREKAQRDSGGTLESRIEYVPTNEELTLVRRAARLRIDRVDDVRELLTRLRRKPAGKLRKIEWGSYLSRRKKELWKPLPKPLKNHWRWIHIDLDWYTVFRHCREEIEFNGTHAPGTPIMENATTEIVPFRIPWDWPDDEITSEFVEWLKERRRGSPTPSPKLPVRRRGGAGSLTRQAKKTLKALAAWRLLQRHSDNWRKARLQKGASVYLGKAYDHASEWTAAKITVRTALDTISRLAWEIQQNSLLPEKG